MKNRLLLATLAIASQLSGAPAKQPVQHELLNLQVELQMVFERIETQETILSSLRQEVENTLSSTKNQSSHLSGKFADLDAVAKALSKDIISLRDHFNTAIKEVDRLSKDVEKQNKNIRQLETAMKAIVDAVSVDKEIPVGGYKVKSGDSLEKIAKEHNTSSKKIKELNSLKNDTIFVGQNLLLP